MSSQVTTPANLLFAAGRIKSLEVQPYYEKALLSLIPVETNRVQTLAVDSSWRVYYNPDYISGITLDELAGVILHEVNHVVRGHLERYQKLVIKNPENWNIATDVVINEELWKSGVKLPSEVISKKTLENMGVNLGGEKDFFPESIYKRLTEGELSRDLTPQTKPGGADQGDGEDEPGSEQGEGNNEDENHPVDCGSITDGIPRSYEDASREGFSESDKDVVLQEVFEDIMEYERGNPGKTPRGLLREVKNRLNPTEDWLGIILKKVNNKISYKSGLKDYSYSRPSRRNTNSSIIMPSMRGSEKVNVYVIIDTSGSMSLRDLQRAISEVQEIMSLNRGNVFVISCDTKATEALRSDDIESVNLVGGGGTDMVKAIKSAEDNETDKPDVIVVFTDGGTPWPKEPALDADYVAAIIKNGSNFSRIPDFFEVVKIDNEHNPYF